MVVRPKSARLASLAAATAALIGVSACAAPESNTPAAPGAVQEVVIDAVQPVSGIYSAFGAQIINGIKLAEKTVQESGMLGDLDFKVNIKDENSEPATAAALTAEIASSQAIAMIGPPGSASALASTPIAQRGGVPYMAVLSFVDGVVEAGDHIYRISTPTNTLSGMMLDEIVERGGKRVAFIYNVENPTLVELAEEYITEGLADRDVEIVSAVGVSTSTSYSQIVAQVLQSDPDMVGILHIGQPNADILNDLRTQGYDGQVFTHGTAAGLFDAIPDMAEGMFYATDFTLDLPFETTRDFITAFEAEYGHSPTSNAAAGYDAVMFLAHALANADTVDRAGLLAAMEDLAASGGYEGTVGPLPFVGEGKRSAQANGVLVELRDGKEVVLKVG